MKLPDFSTFKPLNETRKQMNAELPEDLSFVTIDGRVTNADLERKDAPPEAQKTPAPAAKAAPRVQPKAPRRAAPAPAQHPPLSLAKIALAVQAVILLNIGLAAAWFSYFGAPWTDASSPRCTAQKGIGNGEYGGKLEPFYKRSEYFDKNGVRHTIIEQLPVKK